MILTVELSMTNTSKLHFVNVLLDYKTTSSFIDYNFVYFKKIYTWTISHSILVFNVDSFFNKAGQITKAVNIVLCYKTHLE